MSNKRNFTYLLYVMLLISRMGSVSGQAIRGDLQRFTLMHDRVLIDRSLKSRDTSNFLLIDLNLSSGLRDLVNDASNLSASDQSSVEKRLAALRLLSKNVNTEKFIDATASVAMPLPDIKIKKHRFLNALFYEFNAGILFTISNLEDPTNPYAQTYIRQETKMGLSTIYKSNSEAATTINLYQLTRSDTSARITSNELSQDGDFFDLNDLNEESKLLALDLIYQRVRPRHSYQFGLKEMKLTSQNDTEVLYSERPLLFAQYDWELQGRLLEMRPFVGTHFRQHYSLARGIYFGTKMSIKKEGVPFHLIFKASNQFLTFMPQFKASWFHFTYSLKTPYRNPQDEIWVSTTHNIQLSFPFP